MGAIKTRFILLPLIKLVTGLAYKLPQYSSPTSVRANPKHLITTSTERQTYKRLFSKGKGDLRKKWRELKAGNSYESTFERGTMLFLLCVIILMLSFGDNFCTISYWEGNTQWEEFWGVRCLACDRVWLSWGDHVLRWSCAEVILSWGYPVLRWSCPEVILCWGDPVLRLSSPEVILWWGDPVLRLSCAKVILWGWQDSYIQLLTD